MTNAIASSTNPLNSGKLLDATTRSPYATGAGAGAAAFSLLNSLDAATGAASTGLDALNDAGVGGQRLLADLNQVGMSPKLAAALQGVRRAVEDQQVQAANEARESTQHNEQHGQLQTQARKLVAQTFFGTMLKQMRDSPFKSELFAGGRGGQAFASLFDQHLAEGLGHGAGDKLVNSLVRRLERVQAAANDPSQFDRREQQAVAKSNAFGKVNGNVTPAQ